MIRHPPVAEISPVGLYLKPNPLGDILNKSLACVESKHCAPDVNSVISVRLRHLAANVAYPFADIGTDASRSAMDDRAYVFAMAAALDIRPIKIVITPCGRIWTDNTHWTLAALRKYGVNCAIGEVPHYLVQFTASGLLMFARPMTMGEAAAREALRLADNIQRRLVVGWRPRSVSYTVGELFEDGRYDGAS